MNKRRIIKSLMTKRKRKVEAWIKGLKVKVKNSIKSIICEKLLYHFKPNYTFQVHA